MPHEPILDSELPQMLAFLINGQVQTLNPVGSFAADLIQCKGVALVLLPVMAPFLTALRVAEFARQLAPRQLAPRQILPVPDGYAKDFFLLQR
ncbi:hypothetical protein SAMN00120144_4392 [Hymenobacter roseosalivarius DSM 11622]|uniref:Uncharacterized protein n=1 Tax=Hymenobacter roseosalivarius DSM 11622 TaxID=645990 RepID=A0A1W1W5K3_9BACT|nr:hypothetical protein [Hymenobacter roseosalivarius]SMC00671.1 hypothetical protein SAMN00120144_4392 [Hymenobacter roseosalivarius DSM 11622]